MKTRRSVGVIWLAFAVRLAFYATVFPLWEGFDEWAHFAVIRHVAAGELVVDRATLVPLDVAASMQIVPMPRTLSNLPGPALDHERFWALPPQDRAAREAQFRAIPPGYAGQASEIGAYESLQPPVYYWLGAPLLWILRHCSLATQVFALRWAAVLIGSFVVPLIFLLGRTVFHDDRTALGCAAIASLMPELAVTTARVSNECLAIPLFTAVTWVALQRRSRVALGVLLGIGLITKAYFLVAAAAAAIVFWAPRSLLIAAAISGWWYARNLWTTGTFSGLSEAVALRATPLPTLLRSLDSIPWGRAIDSILFSHLYFGGWSSLMARSWMYHLLYAVIALAAVGLIGLRRNREVRSLSVFYGAFWIAQLYNVVLIYASKGVPTSMGWYLYAVVGAEVALAVAGLTRIAGRWAIAGTALLFALLDLYTMNIVALPYFAGLLGRKPNGALAGLRLSDVHFADLFERLAIFKPPHVTPGVLAALWVAYLIATLLLVSISVQLSRKQ